MFRKKAKGSWKRAERLIGLLENAYSKAEREYGKGKLLRFAPAGDVVARFEDSDMDLGDVAHILNDKKSLDASAMIHRRLQGLMQVLEPWQQDEFVSDEGFLPQTMVPLSIQFARESRRLHLQAIREFKVFDDDDFPRRLFAAIRDISIGAARSYPLRRTTETLSELSVLIVQPSHVPELAMALVLDLREDQEWELGYRTDAPVRTLKIVYRSTSLPDDRVFRECGELLGFSPGYVLCAMKPRFRIAGPKAVQRLAPVAEFGRLSSVLKPETSCTGPQVGFDAAPA